MLVQINKRQREIDEASTELKKLNEELEERVNRRTTELQKINSELSIAEKAHRDSEQRLHDILNYAPILVYINDLEGRYTFVNKEFERLMDLSYHEVINKTDLELFPRDRAERNIAQNKKVIETRQATICENASQKKDGTHYFVDILFPITDSNNNIYATSGWTIDITDRKKVEEKLEKEKYLLQTLLDNLPDRIYFKDLNSHFIRINKSLAKMFGLNDPSEAVGKTDFDFFAEDHARPAFEDEQKIIKTGQALIGKEEKETWSADSSETWVITTKMPLRDLENQIIGTFGISTNITDIKKAEEAQERAIKASNTIIDSIPIPMSVTRISDGKSLRPNKAMAEFHGLTIDEVKETKANDWYANPDERIKLMNELMATRFVWNREVQFKRYKTGEVRNTIISYVPINYDGEDCIVGSFLDITDIKKLKQNWHLLLKPQKLL